MITIEDGHDLKQVFNAFNQIESDEIRYNQIKLDKNRLDPILSDYIRFHQINQQ